MARSLGPADLDPLDAAAAPIQDDPRLRRQLEEYRRLRREQPMVLRPEVQKQRALEQVFPDVAGELRDARLRRDEERRQQAQAAFDAETAAQEEALAQHKASFDEYGRPHLLAPLPGGNGRFQFRRRADGTEEAVDTGAAAAAQSDADFTRWANETPGSERQARYNPQGYAEWQAARDEERQARAAADQQKYGVAEGENWRDNITDEQWQARKARWEADRRQTLNNKITRAKVQGTQNYKDYEERQAKQEANRIKLQQNPFLTLGDSSLNEWQQFVLAQSMLGSRNQVVDPNARDAQSAANALRLLQAAELGGLINPVGQDAARHKLNEDRRASLAEQEESLGATYAPTAYMGFGYDEFTPDEQEAMLKDLVASGHPEEEAKRAVDRQAMKRRAKYRRYGPPKPPVTPAETEGGETIGIN